MCVCVCVFFFWQTAFDVLNDTVKALFLPVDLRHGTAATRRRGKSVYSIKRRRRHTFYIYNVIWVINRVRRPRISIICIYVYTRYGVYGLYIVYRMIGISFRPRREKDVIFSTYYPRRHRDAKFPVTLYRLNYVTLARPPLGFWKVTVRSAHQFHPNGRESYTRTIPIIILF